MSVSASSGISVIAVRWICAVVVGDPRALPDVQHRLLDAFEKMELKGNGAVFLEGLLEVVIGVISSLEGLDVKAFSPLDIGGLANVPLPVGRVVQAVDAANLWLVFHWFYYFSVR